MKDPDRALERSLSEVDRGLEEEVPQKQGRRPRRREAGPAPSQRRHPSQFQGGFTFVRGSQISAAQMLTLMRATLLPEVVGRFAVDGPRLGARNVRTRDRWYQHLVAASEMGEWWVTTGSLIVLPSNVRRLEPDLAPRYWPLDPTGAPVPPTFPTLGGEEAGRTIPSSHRRLPGFSIPGTHGVIVVSNRFVRGRGFRGPLPRRDPRHIVETFLHEAVAHAAQISREREYTHGHRLVDSLAREIEALFPADVTANTPRSRPARIPF